MSAMTVPASERRIGANCARSGPPGCPKLVAVLDLPLRAHALGGGPITTQQKKKVVFACV